MKFIRTHRTPIIIISICFVLMLLATLAVYKMFNPDSEKGVYGDRLQNAPVIDEAIIEQIKLQILNTEKANKVDYRTSVAIMKFTINVNENTKLEEAKKLPNIILEKLSTTVLGFYDIEVYLIKDNDPSYPIIAYRSKNAENFSFVLNRSSENE